MQITTKAPKAGRELTVDFPIPATLGEKVAAYSEAVCNILLERWMVVRLEDFIRVMLTATDEGGGPLYSDAEIVEKIAAWKPKVGERRAAGPRKPKIEKQLAAIALRIKAMLPEQQAAEKARLLARVEELMAREG